MLAEYLIGVKEFAANPNDLTSAPKPHMVEGESQLQRVVLTSDMLLGTSVVEPPPLYKNAVKSF